MPELPEVETVKRGLAKFLPGRRIGSVSSDWAKSLPVSKNDIKKFIIGSEVIAVSRRAKVLLVELSSDYSLVIHLKMTGQLVFSGPNQHFGAGHPNQSLVGQLPDKSTRVIFDFSDGSHLFFNDQRKFGWVKLVPTTEVMNMAFFQKVGPEPLDPEFSWQLMKSRMMRRQKSNIKAVLLDQTVLAGVGNIYADEALWGAKIHPLTLVKDLNDKQFSKLHSELIFVLKLSIDKGGSTNKNYVNAEGKAGSYMSFARVFRREGQLCSRCGAIIVKTRVAGRGTHTCPVCQPRPTA